MVGVHVGQLDVYQQQHLDSDGAQEVDLRLFQSSEICSELDHPRSSRYCVCVCVITWSFVRLSLSLMCWVTILSISSLSMGY